MAEKQKPDPRIVRQAARAIKRPLTASLQFIKSASARILDDQKNDPERHMWRVVGRSAKPRGSLRRRMR